MKTYYDFKAGALTLEEGGQKVVLSIPAGRLQEDGTATFGVSCKGGTSNPNAEVKLQLQGTLQKKEPGKRGRVVGEPIALDETLFGSK